MKKRKESISRYRLTCIMHPFRLWNNNGQPTLFSPFSSSINFWKFFCRISPPTTLQREIWAKRESNVPPFVLFIVCVHHGPASFRPTAACGNKKGYREREVQFDKSKRFLVIEMKLCDHPTRSYYYSFPLSLRPYRLYIVFHMYTGCIDVTNTNPAGERGGR